MKKIIIGVLVLIEVFSLYMMYQINNNKFLNEVNIKDNKINKNTFAIYWDENGTGKYTEYTGSSWPGERFVLDLNNTKCMNEKGEKLNNNILSYSDNSLTLTSNYTAYCTLYFERIPSLGTFCSEEVNMGTCMNNKKETIGSLDNITSTLVGGMYRYQGTDNVNNWICFGTLTKEECTKDDNSIDKYMYRIIGVTPEGELALIKETVIKECGSKAFKWENKYTENDCGKDGSLCTWPLSKLYNRLNGLCKSDNLNCTGTKSGFDGDTNIFIGNSYYEYLNNNSEWLKKISDHDWKYGDTTSNGNYNGDTIYSIENAFKDNVTAKIGLQYIHDYYYAYPNGNPGDGNTATNAWIYYGKNERSYTEWMISKYGISYGTVRVWHAESSSVSYSSQINNNNVVRPVFYLTSSVKINNASGTKDDPYIIS